MSDITTLEKTTEKLSGIVPEDRLLRGESMSSHTSFRVGGPAAAFVTVRDEGELAAVLQILNETGVDYLLAGNGSNLLVADEGYPGIVVKLGGEFEGAEQDEEDGTTVRAGAANLMSRVSNYLTERGLSGFEFASGIPGSIGGAVFMNAGAYGGEIKDIATSVRLMSPDGSSVRDVTADEMEFSYRSSKVQKTGEIILSLTMKLREDDPKEISARVAELQAKRNEKQPVSYPSAGSTFKRPQNGYAAALIEEAGLKGYRVGGATVSEKHSGFVINDGGATADDVLAVMRHVREKVYENSGIMLEPEVRLINCKL